MLFLAFATQHNSTSSTKTTNKSDSSPKFRERSSCSCVALRGVERVLFLYKPAGKRASEGRQIQKLSKNNESVSQSAVEPEYDEDDDDEDE